MEMCFSRRWTIEFLALVTLVSSSANASETKLWRDFVPGMTADEVASIAASVPGVKSAKVKTEDGAATVIVKHGSKNKLQVAERPVKLSFSFRDNRLFGVHLKPEPYAFGGLGCMSSGTKSFFYYDEILSQKYQLLYDERYSESDLDRMASAGKLAKLTNDLKFRLPISRLISKFTDGENVVINESSFLYLPTATFDMCENEGSIRGYGSISYFNKAEYDAVAALQRQRSEERAKDLSKDL